MRRPPASLFILLFAVIMAVIGYNIYFMHPGSENGNPLEASRLNAVDKLGQCPARDYMRLLIRYQKPPIYEEEYRMQDVEGKSSSTYRVRGFGGKQITITSPARETFDVSFLFGALEYHKVWDLVDQQPRGDTSKQYTVYVEQWIDCKHGNRTIVFTDPHYWATTAGRQFAIDLKKHPVPKSAGDLLTLQSTSAANPHYEEVVNDFLAFGSDKYRADVAAARKNAASSK